MPKPKKESPRAKIRRLLKAQRRSLQRRARPKSKGRPRFKNGRDPAKLEWLRGLKCDLWGRGDPKCGGVTEAAHIPSKGAGGTDADTLPLCHHHHISEQHRIGVKTFASLYYGSMEKLRARITYYQTQYSVSVALGWASPEKP